MRFFSTVTAVLFGTTALAAPTTCPPKNKETTVYQIKSFTTRKYDGKNVATLFFNILATNGGTLNFQCVPYDPVTKTGTQKFESGHVYYCGQNSQFSFSYDTSTTDLYLWQDIATGNTIGGHVKTGDPICRAGGSSTNDLICSIPDIVKVDITLQRLGQ